MRHRMVGIVGAALLAGTVFPAILTAQSERGSYARIAILRPNDGDTVDFEAGYIRRVFEWANRSNPCLERLVLLRPQAA
jgi:hypothetical protein